MSRNASEILIDRAAVSGLATSVIRREAVASGGTPLAKPGKARVMLRILEFYCPRGHPAGRMSRNASENLIVGLVEIGAYALRRIGQTRHGATVRRLTTASLLDPCRPNS